MRTVQLVFVMIIGAVSLLGTSFAGQSNQPPEPMLSHDTSADRNKESQTAGEKDQMANHSNDNHKTLVDRKGGVPERRPVGVGTKSAPSHHPGSGKTPVVNDPRLETGRNVLDSNPTSSTRSSDVPDKTRKHPSVPVPAPNAAVDGQQFRSSRDPGARMTTSGGPANSTRTRGINGTDMKPKP
jgi:cytoskeletal protein RodZ